MRYENPDENLEPAVNEILSGIEKFRVGAYARMKSENYNRMHKNQLRELLDRLNALELDLRDLS